MTSFGRRLRRQQRLSERADRLSLAYEERAHEIYARAHYSHTLRMRDALWDAVDKQATCACVEARSAAIEEDRHDRCPVRRRQVGVSAGLLR